MKNKKSYRQVKKTIITGLVFLGLIGIPVKQVESFDFSDIFSKNEQLSKEDVQLIQDIYSSIKENYIEDIDKDQLLEGALKGMVEAVGDPYSEYLNESESQGLDDTVDGSFSGIGVQFEMRNDEPTVVSAINDTPASEAGLMPDDVIVQADGQDLIGKNTNEIIDLIRGPIGTSVELKIRRGSQDFNVTIKRDEIPLISVEASVDEENPSVGKVKITQFNKTTYDELVESISLLRDQGADSFVFDLRYNPGGLLDQALKVCNIFLEDGDSIMQMESRSEKIVYTADSDQYGDFKVDEPYVILINKGSASASEILAVCVKENTDNLIVGETSFGKGSVQTVLNESEMGELKLTFAKWLSPEGNWIHEEGVTPDVEIPAEEVTQAVLMPLDTTIEKGDGSTYSKSLALILDSLGYEVDSEEYFDQVMEEAVQKFQKDHNLTQNGKVDEETARKLNDEIRLYLKNNDLQYEEAVNLLLENSDNDNKDVPA